MESIIERIDPKNPSIEDLKELQEELSRLKDTDIRTVKKEDLVELSDINVDTSLPKLERVITYIKQIKNPYCYLWKGMIIKVSFKGEKSITECIKDAMFCGGPSWPEESVSSKLLKSSQSSAVKTRR